jgi:sensor domain CHASE-containing protein
MQTLDPQSVVALVIPAIGVVVWLVRLEGRINTNEALQQSVLEEVKYIRERIDDHFGR